MAVRRTPLPEPTDHWIVPPLEATESRSTRQHAVAKPWRFSSTNSGNSATAGPHSCAYSIRPTAGNNRRPVSAVVCDAPRPIARQRINRHLCRWMVHCFAWQRPSALAQCSYGTSAIFLAQAFGQYGRLWVLHVLSGCLMGRTWQQLGIRCFHRWTVHCRSAARSSVAVLAGLDIRHHDQQVARAACRTRFGKQCRNQAVLTAQVPGKDA